MATISEPQPLTSHSSLHTSSTWIWYPGDFEVWLGNRFNNRRTERGAMFPPFWKQDSHYPTVSFTKTVVLKKAESIEVFAEGDHNFMLDGTLLFPSAAYDIPTGEHQLIIKVWNQSVPPALFVRGDTIVSDSSWQVTFEDKIWIDEQGVAHGAGIYVHAASWQFCDVAQPPSHFQLPTVRREPMKTENVEDAVLYDFGRETFGFPVVEQIEGCGSIALYYGESREEALDKAHCETLDRVTVAPENGSTLVLPTKAFRFILVEADMPYTLSMRYEYAPYDPAHSGTFRCNDDELNRIWDVSADTLDLTTREFFVDGIKRDRWTWSGDAIQSYLMNYYLRFDTECVKRTIRQLRGKDPVTAHINTIMDYTFYWFKSVHDFYLYSGDIDFVREIYPRMQTLMDYCLSRLNNQGMAEGMPDDWIFVDWVDFPMHKRGVLCFEQILFCKALETMASCAALLRDHPLSAPPQVSLTTENYASDAGKFDEMAEKLSKSIWKTFWNDDAHALMHAIEDGNMNTDITKFPNMFAILYGLADAERQQDILNHVLLNDAIGKITTPYMRFYELEALCMMNRQPMVLQEMKSYWGGMLREGATSFWEKYNPTEKGTQHLAMYGRPYGKSLCHAWGASPLYLLGRYFLGVKPTRPGYEEYEVRPVLGGLEWMEGDVPTPYGLIHVKVDGEHIRVKSHGGRGRLIFGNVYMAIPPNEEIVVDISQTRI